MLGTSASTALRDGARRATCTQTPLPVTIPLAKCRGANAILTWAVVTIASRLGAAGEGVVWYGKQSLPMHGLNLVSLMTASRLRALL
jgi:hypothetical protein